MEDTIRLFRINNAIIFARTVSSSRDLKSRSTMKQWLISARSSRFHEEAVSEPQEKANQAQNVVVSLSDIWYCAART